MVIIHAEVKDEVISKMKLIKLQLKFLSALKFGYIYEWTPLDEKEIEWVR